MGRRRSRRGCVDHVVDDEPAGTYAAYATYPTNNLRLRSRLRSFGATARRACATCATCNTDPIRFAHSAQTRRSARTCRRAAAGYARAAPTARTAAQLPTGEPCDRGDRRAEHGVRCIG